MKKNNLIRLLIFGIVFMLFGCVNDEVIQNLENSGKNRIRIVKIKEVPQILPTINKFKIAKNRNSKPKNNSSNYRIEDLDLDLNNVLVYEKPNGYTSYSIPIINIGVNYYENLHIINTNENYFIYRYSPQNISQGLNLENFTGHFEKFDLDYNLQISDFFLNGVRQQRNTVSGKITSDNLIDPQGDDYVLEDCIIDIDCTPLECDCYDKIPCRVSVHCMLGGGGTGTGTGIGTGTGTGSGGTGGGGSGTGTGSSGTSTGSSGTGTGTSNTDPVDPIDQPLDEIVPIIVEEPPVTPCSELKKLTQTLATKSALKRLQDYTNLDYEKGFEITKNNDTNKYNPPLPAQSSNNNLNAIKMRVGGENIGAFHTHPHINTNTYPMFSFPDISYLFDVANLHQTGGQTKVYEEYFLTLTVSDGTFAIKIKNWAKFATIRNNPEKWKKFENKWREKFNDRDFTDNIDLFKKALMEVMTELDAGVGLYEADSNDLNSWSEVVLDNTQTNGVNTTPCN